MTHPDLPLETNNESPQTAAPRKRSRRARRFAVAAALLLAAGFAGAIAARIVLYHRLLGFDPRQDYQYAFADAKEVPVRLDRGGFRWPEGASEWDTAFLRARFFVTPAGWLEDPVVTARVRGETVKQYLERGTAGVRFINLSALAAAEPKPGERVSLAGRFVRWDAGPAALLLFHNGPFGQGRILVMAPHPDDAEIAAFGLYYRRHALLLTVTPGDAGHHIYSRLEPDPKAQSILKGRLRAWDSIAAALWAELPIDRSLCMGYFDKTLQRMYRRRNRPVKSVYAGLTDVSFFREFNQSDLLPKRPRSATWEHLVEDFETVLRAFKPTVIVAPHPIFDGHPDHQYASLALFEALQRPPARRGRLLLYTNHCTTTPLHPIGWLDGAVSLPPRFTGEPLPGGVLSVPLSWGRQTAKLFALDAMHALRPPPAVTVPPRSLLRICARRIKRRLRGDRGFPLSHFRRAVRPNELFFVRRFKDAAALAQEFLARESIADRPRQ